MEDLQNKSDAELVSLTLKNKEYFRYLMERYESKFFRYIRRFTGLCKESVEDVLQEVFLKIYRNLNDFDQSLSFSSWVYRIAHNEAVNYLRKHRGKETISLETDEEDVVNLIEVLASDIDVVSEVRKNDLQIKVREALTHLPENYREVLVLRFLEDKNYTDISDILKKPMGTVATLLNRAKTQFKILAEKYNFQSLIS